MAEVPLLNLNTQGFRRKTENTCVSGDLELMGVELLGFA
jgi:hypothetical protein